MLLVQELALQVLRYCDPSSVITPGVHIVHRPIRRRGSEGSNELPTQLGVPFCSALASSLVFVSLHQSEIVVCETSASVSMTL